MRIVVDTNIAFSAILNTNSNIARILLQPKSRLHFYSTDLLLEEINEHKEKIISIAEYSNEEFEITIRLITSKIKFINLNLIPQNILVSAENLVSDVDDNDTEFVALTDHIRGKLWSGDLELQKGLKLKGWNKFISTADLIELIQKKK
jgi:predicted nucleic acid-binding protein